MRIALLTAFMVLVGWPAMGAQETAKPRLDVQYGSSDEPSARLDIYPTPGKTAHPILIWIHGGAWRIGDKAHVQAKPRAFNTKGFVFVSINYRLQADATYQDQAADVAQAIHWVHDHAREFGAAPDRIFLMGHSAGAHLAALVATDDRYLKAVGMSLRQIQGVILVDGAGYDIPRQIELSRLPRMREMYQSVFGTNLATQQDASPITHVAKGKGIPPFLLLYVSTRRDSKIQSYDLADRLKLAGSAAEVVPAHDKSHGSINREMGEPDDPPTQAVFDFLEKRLAALQ